MRFSSHFQNCLCHATATSTIRPICIARRGVKHRQGSRNSDVTPVYSWCPAFRASASLEPGDDTHSGKHGPDKDKQQANGHYTYFAHQRTAFGHQRTAWISSRLESATLRDFQGFADSRKMRPTWIKRKCCEVQMDFSLKLAARPADALSCTTIDSPAAPLPPSGDCPAAGVARTAATSFRPHATSQRAAHRLPGQGSAHRPEPVVRRQRGERGRPARPWANLPG